MAALTDPPGNGSYRCPDGHVLTVSGYKGWGGSVTISYHGKTHALPNCYKFDFGKSPDSTDGFISILGGDGVIFKIDGYIVFDVYQRR